MNTYRFGPSILDRLVILLLILFTASTAHAGELEAFYNSVGTLRTIDDLRALLQLTQEHLRGRPMTACETQGLVDLVSRSGIRNTLPGQGGLVVPMIDGRTFNGAMRPELQFATVPRGMIPQYNQSFQQSVPAPPGYYPRVFPGSGDPFLHSVPIEEPAGQQVVNSNPAFAQPLRPGADPLKNAAVPGATPAGSGAASSAPPSTSLASSTGPTCGGGRWNQMLNRLKPSGPMNAEALMTGGVATVTGGAVTLNGVNRAINDNEPIPGAVEVGVGTYMTIGGTSLTLSGAGYGSAGLAVGTVAAPAAAAAASVTVAAVGVRNAWNQSPEYGYVQPSYNVDNPWYYGGSFGAAYGAYFSDLYLGTAQYSGQ